MSINRTAEYMVLWKSHKRAEWAAVRLDRQAAALRQRLGRNPWGEKDDRPLPSSQPTASKPGNKSAEKGAVTPARGQRTVPAPTVLTAPAAPADGGEEATFDELKWLETESRRMGQLCAEIGSELARATALLTVAQRKSAEKMLKEWEEAAAAP